MPRKTLPAKSNEPLKSYGPNNQIQALSYDGGIKWSAVPVRPGPPQLKEYTRRIVAVVPKSGATPVFLRRIGTSFEPLRDADILTGWGSLEQVLLTPKGEIDAIILPYETAREYGDDLENVIAQLRKISPLIYADLDDAPGHAPSALTAMMTLISNVDVVMAPSDLIGISLRKYVQNIYTVPPTIDPRHWANFSHHMNSGKVRVAVQPSNDRFANEAVQYVQERMGDRLEIVVDRWFERLPEEDPKFYRDIDIVVIGAPDGGNRYTNNCLLSPLAAGCAVLADKAYNRTIISGHSGILVAKPGPAMWRQELYHLCTDRAYRVKMMAGARQRSRLFVNRVHLNRLALPYRMHIKERDALGMGSRN